MPKIVLTLAVYFAFTAFGHAQVPQFPQGQWTEGKHYFAVKPAQPTKVAPGKVEVVEVFSYGCPACYSFYPIADKIKAALPRNAELRYVPASWNVAEAWPMFQQAYLTAEIMGIADKAHAAMFNAIWASGELAVVDFKTNKLKKTLPTIENAAAFYARTAGVKPQEFLAVAKGFSVNAKMKMSDALVKAYRAESTPTLVVNGKYRLTPASAGGAEQTLQLVNWLIAKESKP
jgi:protein dithiol oxidoreductase (disulfide-forming)